MEKLYTYMMVMTGITILFFFGGLLNECSGDGLCEATTPSSLILNEVLHPENVKQGTLSSYILIGMTSLAAIAAIAIGYATKNVELAAMTGVATWLFTLLCDFLVVFNKVRSQSPTFAILLFGPLMLGLVVLTIDWWRGRD